MQTIIFDNFSGKDLFNPDFWTKVSDEIEKKLLTTGVPISSEKSNIENKNSFSSEFLTLWNQLNKKTADKYFFNNYSLFEEWVSMLPEADFVAVIDIISENKELFLDDEPNYVKLLNNISENENDFSSNLVYMFAEIKKSLHDTDMISIRGNNYVLIASRDVNKITEFKKDLIRDGLLITHKLTCNDPETDQDILIFIFETEVNDNSKE